jgi:hypothetical protein
MKSNIEALLAAHLQEMRQVVNGSSGRKRAAAGRRMRRLARCIRSMEGAPK